MQEKSKAKTLAFGIIVVIIGIMIGVVPIFLEKEHTTEDNNKVNDYLENTSKVKEEEKENVETPSSDNKEEEFLLILEIPKIGLKRGVYPLGSDQNTIEKNVAILKESSLPQEVNGNVVLAAHNGTARISYFNQFHRLELNDIVYIYHEGIKYTYHIDEIYDVKKDGSVEISRDLNQNTLTLITCKKDTNDRQLVVVSYLVNKEEY